MNKMVNMKDLKRMCESYLDCNSCPLYIGEVRRCIPCNFPLFGNIDEVIDKWVLEHPVKTYAMDFFEKFPNASRRENGAPKICTRYIYPELANDCCGKCFDCWNQEIKEKKQ